MRVLLDERARLVEQLALIDLDVEQVRAAAAEGAYRSGPVPAPAFPEAVAFEVSARDFVRGAVEPPDEVDRRTDGDLSATG